jgi:hypothetical protein
LKNTSTKHSKYVVNQKLEHITFRELLVESEWCFTKWDMSLFSTMYLYLRWDQDKSPRTKAPLGQKLRQKAPNNDEKKMFFFIPFFILMVIYQSIKENKLKIN